MSVNLEAVSPPDPESSDYIVIRLHWTQSQGVKQAPDTCRGHRTPRSPRVSVTLLAADRRC